MKALIHENASHSDWFVVNWNLGNTCNYSCSYCPKFLHSGSVPWPELSILTSFIDKVIEQKKDKRVAFEFTGGEVTVYKQFSELCDHIKSKGAAVALISNGGRTAKWWTRFGNKADHVCLSFHAEEGDPAHFIDIVNITSKNMKTHVNVMMHPDHWEKCITVAENVINVPNITFALQPLIVDFGDKLFNYTPEQHAVFENQWELYQKKIVRDNNSPGFSIRGAMREIQAGQLGKVWQPHIMIAEKINDWAGWSCSAGVEQIIIDFDGSIWRGWCRQGGKIGNTNDTNFQLTTDWVTCNKNFCHCNFDIMCTKVEQ